MTQEMGNQKLKTDAMWTEYEPWIKKIDHQPYSVDLALCELWLFSKLKIT
jgi:hypothetical protein